MGVREEHTAGLDDSRLGGAIVALVGVLVTLVPLFDIYQDATQQGGFFTSVLENVPLLVLSGVVVAGGVWLWTSDWAPGHVRTILTWMVGSIGFTAILFSFVVAVQWFLQGRLRPFIIAADVIIVAAVGGLLVGVRTAELRRAQRGRFRALFDHVPNPIAETELEDDVAIARGVNPAFTNVFGYEAEDIVGRPLEDHIVPPDVEERPVGDVETDAELPPEEIWDRDAVELETVDGRREFIRLTVPVDSEHRRSGYGIYIDITTQKQRQERLEVLARILRHDIRNQINIVVGATSSLEETVGTSPELDEIRTAASNLLALSERTRMAEDLAAAVPDQHAIDVEETIDTVVDRVTDDHDVNVDTTVPDDAFVKGTADLGTALMEIVENAIVHNDTDEPTVEIEVSETYDGKYHDIEVADDGPGIAPTKYEVVTGEEEEIPVAHPDGLGLWLAHWICRASGGELEFDASDEGTTVTLRIPSADPGHERVLALEADEARRPDSF